MRSELEYSTLESGLGVKGSRWQFRKARRGLQRSALRGWRFADERGPTPLLTNCRRPMVR